MRPPELSRSDRAPGLLLGPDVTMPDDAQVGAYVVIHAGTVLGAGVCIQDGAVLGKPPVFGASSKADREDPPPLVVGDGATIGAGAVVAAGAAIGPGVLVGDMAHVRERAVIGRGSLVGSRCSIDNDVLIAARVRIQTGAYIAAFSELEEDVFVAPFVVTTNDPTAGRRPSAVPLRGVRLRRGCRVGARAVLLPGIEVGEDSFVGAGSVVTGDVAPRSVVIGAPARHSREVGPDDEIPAG
jgi:UDP-2-acetamido-3-amino-2,3-dideoxy-glucuronate N-acetyltransferase